MNVKPDCCEQMIYDSNNQQECYFSCALITMYIAMFMIALCCCKIYELCANVLIFENLKLFLAHIAEKSFL